MGKKGHIGHHDDQQHSEQAPLTTPGESTWAVYQRTARVSSTTLIRTSDALIDPQEIADSPQAHLLDIYEHETEAARIWLRLRRRNPFTNEGVIRLRYQETELLPPTGTEDVLALWWYLLHLVEDFQEHDRAETGFPESPTPITLETIKRRVFFTADDIRVMVEPEPFLASLVDEAERFFQWTTRNLAEPTPTAQIEAIRARLAWT